MFDIKSIKSSSSTPAASPKRHSRVQLPNTKVLVLGAICISAIVITLAYKISLADQEKAALQSTNLMGTQGEDDSTLSSDQRIAGALYESRIASLGALASSSNPFNPAPKDSLSDSLSKGVFAAYQQYEQSGGQMNEDDLASAALSGLNTDGLPQPIYSLNQISVFVPSTTDEIKNYANTFAKIYVVNVTPVAKNPEKYSSNLSGLAAIYKKVASDLIKIKTPLDVAQAQLNIANSFAMMAEAFPLVDGQTKDPVKALLGLRTVKEAMQSQVTMFTKISAYLKQNAILFEKGDAGIMWNTIPTTTDGIDGMDQSSQSSQ